MGVYRPDSRGAERRWLPLTRPNCETSLTRKHYVIYSIAVRMSHTSLSSSLPGLVLASIHMFSRGLVERLFLSFSFNAAVIQLPTLIYLNQFEFAL